MASYWTNVFTPPESHASLSTPGDYDSEDGCMPTVSMSTLFYPKEDMAYDLVIISSDGVLFAVEKQHILGKSTNFFGGLLADKTCQSFIVEENSNILNLVLCAIQDIDFTQFRPGIDDLANMLASLGKYGVNRSELITSESSIYKGILTLAIPRPLESYALICQYGLENLAIQISHHLLPIQLSDLTDDLCVQMGAVYLRRLVFLHLGRTERLKILLDELPSCHPPIKECDTLDQKCKLLKGWKDTVASLTLDIGPNTPIPLIHHRFNGFANTLVCKICQKSARERVRSLILDWATVKSTI